MKLQLENVTEKGTQDALTKSGVRRGGFSHPANCSACEKLAVVVPYRARAHQLLVLLANLHPMLQRQQRDYAIFVVEQEGNGSFNRAALMNVGFLEALKTDDHFSCFVFHLPRRQPAAGERPQRLRVRSATTPHESRRRHHELQVQYENLLLKT